jgi:hypothetical protein
VVYLNTTNHNSLDQRWKDHWAAASGPPASCQVTDKCCRYDDDGHETENPMLDWGHARAEAKMHGRRDSDHRSHRRPIFLKFSFESFADPEMQAVICLVRYWQTRD